MEHHRTIAVMTSGGDSPGMNAALRAVVRAGLTRGWNVLLISDGWQGVMEGSIRSANWSDVSHILQLGGTVIGSARSDKFRTKEGRKEACKQLLTRKVDGLVCVGGDGSLTGANLLRTEWSEHLASLGVSSASSSSLDIVGMVGSIDNDLIGFTQTIGADSALHRIIHAVDCIVSTAVSHGRTFIIEVMGRSSGYLALAASMICGSDWVFIPERPVDAESWKEDMCQCIMNGRSMSRRKSIILLAEGAIDSKGNKITAEKVKVAIETQLHHDTRTTTLGHVQRGGSPSAFDRFQATMLGVEAIDHLAKSEKGSVSVVVGMQGYTVETKSLMQCVKDTQAVAKCLEGKDFDSAFKARGSAFSDFWQILVAVSGPLKVPRSGLQCVAVCTVGAPAPGMNHAVRAAVRLLLTRGHKVFLVKNGFEGLQNEEIEEAHWMSCSGWAGAGGSFLGTGRTLPNAKSMDSIRRSLMKRSISGFVVIGGNEAFVGSIALNKEFGKQLAIAVIPATISNNCVGTEVTIGMDRASNNLMTACDQVKQSCIGYEKRVFVVESIGRSCGFQSMFGAICSGADLCYIPERPPSLKDMERATELFRHRFAATSAQIALVINSESASDVFTTSFIRRMHEKTLAHLKVSGREALLQGLQQGGDPSPMDRIFSGRLALAAVDHLCGFFAGKIELEAVGCGLIRDERSYTPLFLVDQLLDHRERRPLNQYWLERFTHCFDSVTFPPIMKARI